MVRLIGQESSFAGRGYVPIVMRRNSFRADPVKGKNPQCRLRRRIDTSDRLRQDSPKTVAFPKKFHKGEDISMIKPEVLKKLTALLGPDRVKTSKEDLLSYSYDAFIAEYAPEAVVFPKTTAEVAEIMKIASANSNAAKKG